MTFPGAHATIYRNEAGEPTGYDYPSDDNYDDEEAYWERQDNIWADMICPTHKCYVPECPTDCRGDEGTIHQDETCCGPHGCCSGCCGTEEDDLRGDWHEGCDIGGTG